MSGLTTSNIRLGRDLKSNAFVSGDSQGLVSDASLADLTNVSIAARSERAEHNAIISGPSSTGREEFDAHQIESIIATYQLDEVQDSVVPEIARRLRGL